MIRLFKYGSLFLWIAGAAALYGLYATKGLPHVIFSYTFLDNGDRFNPYAKRHYTSCSFAGPYSSNLAMKINVPWRRLSKMPRNAPELSPSTKAICAMILTRFKIVVTDKIAVVQRAVDEPVHLRKCLTINNETAIGKDQ